MRKMKKKGHALKLSELVVGEWYIVAVGNQTLKNVFIHCLMQINSTIRRTNKAVVYIDLIG
jgi:hypothetical protein